MNNTSEKPAANVRSGASKGAKSIHASALGAALMRARKRLNGSGTEVSLRSGKDVLGLWNLLQEEVATESKTAVNEQELAALLLESQGVAVIADEQWDQFRMGKESPQAPSYQEIHVGDSTYLLSPDPWQKEVTTALMRSGTPGVRLALARGRQWAQVTEQRSKGVQASENVAISENAAAGKSHSPRWQNDSTDVVQFVDDAIAHAVREGASDIHFETDKDGLGIKFRLDGVMAPGPRMAGTQKAEEVVSRIKVMAQLDITERRRPQDGRIRWSHTGFAEMDLRVSVMPSIFGEDVVLRLLDKTHLQSQTDGQSELTLHSLGFEESLVEELRELAERPHGMLLITGPTGSGKTTTVYAALSEANNGLEKIVTIEDPVEYQLTGVLQIPVNEQKGLTFATGLRSILRHDPDKILVGEIRDPETAQIAVQSSLTGHMVFTTVHANSLFDVLGRFQHFGIEPFALASALNGVVVQRLLRKLCPHCHAWRAPTEKEANKLSSLDLEVPDRLPVAVGCPHCRRSGYKGRFVTSEVHVMTDAMRELIVGRAPMEKMRSALYPDHSQRLLARAVSQVVLGNTTLEEVRRVVGLV
jgi:general secretion pathway protein E